MASRYSTASSSTPSSQQTSTQSSSGTSSNSSQNTSSSSSFTGITDENALATLSALIEQLASGGTAADKTQQVERTKTIADTRAAAANYSKDAAFADAADLITQSLQKSLEASQPAISKSIQGAGTSASAMQGLLATKASTDAATAAGALGAQQATNYGGITAQLSSVLEALTKADPSITNSLVNALGLLKNTTSESQSQGTSIGSSQQSSSGSSQGSSGSGQQQQQQSSNSGLYDFASDPYFAHDNGGSGLISYEVPSGSNAWANYSGQGAQGTSYDYGDGYMSITNTTDSYDYW